MGSGDGGSGLVDLPLDCISAIIGRTTPLDACRVAAVCQAFAAATKSELVWQALLPSDVRSSGTNGASFKELLEALARGIFLPGGRQKYLLLPSSGDVCRILSVEGMGVTWGQDARFWKWEPSRSSCFGKVAHLVAVCWLEVSGTWSGSLTPGTYSLLWRLKVANPKVGQVHFLSWRKPLAFRIRDLSSGKLVDRELDLSKQVLEEWFEFEVGQIHVPGDRLEAKQLDFEFFIREVDSSYWKGGLYLDCLTLRPSR